MLCSWRLCIELFQPALLRRLWPAALPVDEREADGELPRELPPSLSDITVDSWELHWCGWACIGFRVGGLLLGEREWPADDPVAGGSASHESCVCRWELEFPGVEGEGDDAVPCRLARSRNSCAAS